MRLIINCSTLKGTGVTQVAVSFINECISFPENEYVVFMSPKVAANVNYKVFPENFKFFIFGKHSLYGIWGIFDIVKMKQLEAILNPDAVFSVFGPSLWKPKAPHLQGYAFPHYVYTESPVFNHMSFRERVSVMLRRYVHLGHMKNEGDYFVCETDDVSMRLSEKCDINRNCIFTVSNTANAYFIDYPLNMEKKRDDSEFRFYTLCSNSPHKNLIILNVVIPYLKNMIIEHNIKFYVTIENDEYDNLFTNEVKDFVVNVGPLKVADCPSFVDSCDALFLPTLLECFSASYPEAMLLKKPIITSDLPFARTVCDDAALYFDPLNAENISEMIIKLVKDKELYKRLQVKGTNRFKKFPSPQERAKAYLNICYLISKH